MDNNELYHHGILGMKWGVRRSAKQLGNDSGSSEPKKKRKVGDVMDKATDKSIATGKGKDSISPAEKIARESGNAISNASNIYDSMSRMKAAKKGSKSNTMSDDELRSAIARMNLEKQYNSLSSETKSKGMVYVKETLSIVGSVVGIAASTAAVVSTVKKLRG